MGSLDNLLAESLNTVIETKLGKVTYEKIKDRLDERYGITVLESIKDFYKMDSTLREFFGPGADQIEKDFLSNFISFGSSSKDRSWITIHDQSLAKSILESFGDKDKKIILENSMREPQVILDILNNSNLPKSSGYRMIKELITDGFLTEKGYSSAIDGRRVTTYVSLFENIKIDIQKNKTVVKVEINKDFIKDSFIVSLIKNNSR